MLADVPPSPAVGRLAPGVYPERTLLKRIVEFVARQLPAWRDHPLRPRVDSEVKLTDQLGCHLEDAARIAFDVIKFSVEPPDDGRGGRTLDLAARPAGSKIWVGGRPYSPFDILLPIECKRLPTPTAKGRDEREYVVSARGTTGGIQRFKLGLHGGRHDTAAIIAYAQTGRLVDWPVVVNGWLEQVARDDPFWADESLVVVEAGGTVGVMRLHSTHRRGDALPDIELHHLWVDMMGGGEGR